MSVPADRFAPMLMNLGFTPAERGLKSAALVRCNAALDARAAAVVGRLSIWSPGRIEVFGKHTDYAGGRSLLTAVERGFIARVAPRSDARVCVVDAASGVACETLFDPSATAPEGHWSNYVATVARRIARNFPDARCGVDITFESDLPVAAGVSSSSALLIAVFLGLAAVNRLRDSAIWHESLPTSTQLAGYLGAMENGGAFGRLAGESGVGTLGGSQDQTAILCAEPGKIVDYGWMPVRRHAAYALPASHCFVVASSGIVAEKSAGARELYNRASRLVTHLVQLWNQCTGRSDGSLAAAMETAADAPDVLRAAIEASVETTFTADELSKRLNQFLLETYTLIPAAAAAFTAHDWLALGTIAARSQQAAEQWLGNQIAETSALVRLALEGGAVAASAFGAGFGGSVWALVATADAAQFADIWASAYRQQFPAAGAAAMFFATAAGPAAATWSDDPTAD